MSKIWDIIQTVIFGPPLVSVKTQPVLVSADRYASLVTGDEARPWVDYWQRMGVDDPVAAARACEGRRWIRASDVFRSAGRAMETFATLGPWNAELIRLRDRSMRERTNIARLFNVPEDTVEIVPDTGARVRTWIVRDKLTKFVFKTYTE